jgi:uncharacterized protein (TIGR02453 family)
VARGTGHVLAGTGHASAGTASVGPNASAPALVLAARQWRVGDMGFSGWPEEALEFYEGLEADNSKAYWTEQKAVYEDKVLRPMTELLEELGPEFGEGKVFRPYRDVRFSKDKSPYKTQLGARLGRGYVQFSAKGLAVGDGMYGMEPDQLDRYRRAVASDATGAKLEQVIAGIEGNGYGVHGRDALKSAPRGYPGDHPRIGLLRYKGIVAWMEWPVEPWLETPAAKDRICSFLRATEPLGTWLDANVGPSR